MAKLTDSRKRVSSRESIWAAIREIREGITAAALADKMRIPESTVQDYVRGLAAAG